MPRFGLHIVTLTFVLVTAFSTRAAEETTPDLSPLTGDTTPLKSGDRIVFVGDSITMQGGFVELIAKGLKEKQPKLDVKITRYGLNGGRVPDVKVGKTQWGQAKPYEKILSEDRPTHMVIFLGVNDVMHSPGTSKEDFEKGLKELITLAQREKVAVVLASPAISGEKIEENALNKKLDEYTAISKKVAADTKSVFCDLRTAFKDFLAKNNKDKKNSGLLTYDGIHMGPGGNKLIAQTMAKSLAEAAAARGKEGDGK